MDIPQEKFIITLYNIMKYFIIHFIRLDLILNITSIGLIIVEITKTKMKETSK
jgi:hypothetical protein